MFAPIDIAITFPMLNFFYIVCETLFTFTICLPIVLDIGRRCKWISSKPERKSVTPSNKLPTT